MTNSANKLVSGEVYKAKVSDITSSGHTIVDHKSCESRINLGKTDKEIGESIKFKYKREAAGVPIATAIDAEPSRGGNSSGNHIYTEQNVGDKATSPPDDWKDRKGDMMSNLNNLG